MTRVFGVAILFLIASCENAVISHDNELYRTEAQAPIGLNKPASTTGVFEVSIYYDVDKDAMDVSKGSSPFLSFKVGRNDLIDHGNA